MDLRESIRKQNDVAFTIAKHLFSKEAPNSNIVFSPLSLHIVLSIMAAGSVGATRDQLLNFLRSNSIDNLNSFASQLVAAVFSDGSAVGGPRLSCANSVWIDQRFPLKHSFEHIVTTYYKATLASVDFQSKPVEVTNEINSWAEKETNGLIKEVLPPGSIDDITNLIFANALYFKGAWDLKFDASITKDHDFHLLDGSSVKAPFMISRKDQFISDFADFKVLRLPYHRGEDKRQFSMYILLPNKKDGISALVEKMDSGFLERNLPYRRVEVGDFRIPKFKISFGFETSKALQQLGVVSPFIGGLKEMVDFDEDMCVSYMYHKSFIEVNEEGSEAAAVTCAGQLVMQCVQQRFKINFVADHPFWFMIKEDTTRTVLFMGRVLNPLDG